MAAEIERKFLVTGDSWNDGSPGVRIAQGYLSLDPDRCVRVRLAGDEAWLTIKGRTEGITRAEFEYPIPVDDARALLGMCLSSVIDKTRHRVPFAGHLWEVDVFHGANEGLVLAEVELADESAAPPLPPWAGAEVSAVARYYNASLAVTPFSVFREHGSDSTGSLHICLPGIPQSKMEMGRTGGVNHNSPINITGNVIMKDWQ